MSFKKGQAPPPGSKPWAKGVSGNPGGKPKGLDRQLREKYGKDVPALVGVLVDIGLGKIEVDKSSDRIKAIDSALDRIVGKPLQSVEGTLDLGATPEHLALLAALRMTPHERRQALAAIDEEDARALADPVAGDEPPIDEPSE